MISFIQNIYSSNTLERYTNIYSSDTLERYTNMSKNVRFLMKHEYRHYR